MAEMVTLRMEPRSVVGTRAARALRAEKRLPAVIYGHGEAVESVSMDRHELMLALAHGVRTLNVELGGKSQQCLIKEIQYNHLGTLPIHMDLTRVDVNELVRVMVGVEPRGVPIGLSHGGILDQQLGEIEVECLVSDIPSMLRPIVTHLEVDDTLLVQDIELPVGVVALTSGDDRVVTIHKLAAAADEPEAAEAEEESSDEPERIGRVRKDEESKESS
ncbi:MAG: 50S ribosomal protein L25 [Planctomycetes bacterium]|nr:50S ribosomal protein L25 [Planctomycetota bacterium]